MLQQDCHKQFYRFLLVWVLLFALKLGFSQSQQEDYTIETIPFEGELSGYRGTCMLQDSQGFMWFGSNESGLCRYDGRSLKIYRYDPTDRNSLSFDIIYKMIEDREGYIWIATAYGLNRFDPSTEAFKQYFHDPGNPTTIADDYIFNILEDSQGFIWTGTRLGCSRFDKSTESFKNYEISPAENRNEIPQFDMGFSLYEDKSGTIWIQNGLYGLCRIENEVDTIEFIASFPCLLYGMMEDRSGRFWINTDCGLYLFDKDRLIFDLYENLTENSDCLKHPMVSSIMEDRQGAIWIRSSDGLYKYNQQLELLFHWKHEVTYDIHYPFNRDRRKQYQDLGSKDHLFEDNAGTIWFYTLDGINKLFKEQSYFKVFDPDPKERIHVHSLFVESDISTWIGTHGGVYNFNSDTRTYSKYRLPAANDVGNSIYSEYVEKIHMDSMGILWMISGAGALYKLNLHDNRLIHKTSDIRQFSDVARLSIGNLYHFFEDGEGRLWTGEMFQPPSYYDREQNKMIHLTHNSSSTDSIRGGSMIRHEINAKSLLATGWSGVYKIVLPFIQTSENEVMPTNVIQYKPDTGSSESQWIRRTTTSYLDSTGTLWLGTNGSGLLRLKEKRRLDSTILDFEIDNFNLSHGLNSNRIISIQDDFKGNLWLGTVNGLSKFNQINESFTNYSLKQGLPSTRFYFESAGMSKNGELFFGTSNGMISFHPDSIQSRPVIAPVKLTELKIQNRPVNPSENTVLKQAICLTDQIDLRHNQNYLSIEFAALNYIQPESNQYKYMLEGLDDDWIASGTRNFASYANLNPGKYMFRVISSNYSGAWNMEGATLRVIIHPPPWLAWWAYVVYSIILISIALSLWRWFINRARLRHALEIERIEKEKVEEIDHMKSRFFANISHEFRTPLTLILGPVEDLIKRRTERLELSRDLATTIHRNSKRLHGLINQLLDISKLETGSVKLQVSEGHIEEFVRTLSLSFLSLAESKRIKYEMFLPGTDRLILFDQDKLEKILTNLISNAFKFTSTGESIEINLQFLEVPGDTCREFLEIKVADKGKGIPAEKLNKIFDRFYQVSDSNTREVEGTGIGLALTKELVDLYRGEISVESEIGKGSTFTVWLPCLEEDFRAEEIVESTPTKQTESGNIESVSVPRETESIDLNKDLSLELYSGMPVILVVEDHVDLRNYIIDNLKSNYRILSAENGNIGLEKAIENIPDLIISDVMMPKMDGIEMCKRLRSDRITNHIPVIMLTARADRGTKLEGLETGVDDYLIKPFDTEELKVRIKNLLEQRVRLKEKFRTEFASEQGAMESSPRDLFLKGLNNILDQYISDPEFKIEQLSTKLHMSRSQVYRKIEAVTGYSPNELIRNLRLKKAAGLFRSGHTNINQVMLEVGYLHQSYFSKCFRELYRITPTAYIKQNNR